MERPLGGKTLGPVGLYYTEKVRQYGATSRGVDWNTRQSQELRFDQILGIVDSRKTFSLNDFGCGYGALFAYLRKRRFRFRYEGFDIAPEMIRVASQKYGHFSNARFRVDRFPSRMADYSVASGIFNVRLKAKSAVWKSTILETLRRMNLSSRKAFSFNCLTLYSDRNRRRKDLYYADPCFWFDYCKKKFSRDVALLHDYGLYEFTILVRKNH
jgi:hypothetical protein